MTAEANGSAAAQQRASATAASLTESVIREMTRLALQHNAINLAQGFPDFPAPDQVKHAAVAAIEQDLNQYPITWGQVSIREALADKYREHYGMVVDPERDVCVACGATEAMIAAMIGCVDPGQEVIVFEPFYENYGAAAAIAGAVPRYVTLREPGWSFDEAELAAAFTSRTRAIVINTPGNPTGKVFSAEELGATARLCQRHGVLAITDEIYEHIVYAGARHIPMATVAGMEDRTITISALSKSYAVTGWRGGWAIAAPGPTGAGRRGHHLGTVGAPTPFQEAGAVALRLPGSYYERLGGDCTQGDDTATARALTREVGVATVPGSSFYSRPELGRSKIRFSYSKKLTTLHEAGRRLARLAPDAT